MNLFQLFLRFLGFFLISVTVWIALGFAIEFSPLAKKCRIYSLPLRPGQIRSELITNVIDVLLFAASSAFLVMYAKLERCSKMPFGTQFLQIFSTFYICFFVFKFYYYFTHRAFHTPRFFKFHARHHLSRVINPISGLSMGLVEMLSGIVGLILIPGCLSFLFPMCIEGWLLHVSFNLGFVILGHTNVEITPRFYGLRPWNWVFHPITFHAIHHARFNRHYCFYLTALDRVFGTEWEDWEKLHARIASGKAARSLNERG